MSTETTAHDRAGTSVPPRENLVRAVSGHIEFRDDSPADGSLGTLHGHFAVFNEWTRISSMWEGEFMERIAPGAFKKTMRENRSSIKVLYDHGKDPSVGNKPLGPLDDLREDDTGGYYEVPLLDTSYNRDLLPALKAGLLGASFRFKVLREDVVEEPAASDANPKGLPERTIKEIQLYELGPVTFPAYQSATAGVRSMTDDYIMRGFLQQPDKLRAMLTSFLSDQAAQTAEDEEESPTRTALPVETEETTGQAPAPTASAEPEAHPAPVRRSTVLFGLHTEEKPKWEL